MFKYSITPEICHRVVWLSIYILYALKTLKAHGLQGRALWDMTHATLVSQITYASPSWRGFIKAEEIARLNAILSKARRFGYLPY